MAGSHMVAACRKNCFQQPAEFYLWVTDNTGVWGFTLEIAPGEIIQNRLLKFICQVNDGERYIQVFGYFFYPRNLLVEIRLGQGHEKTMDIMAHIF